jgi:uncharacterized phage-associated protein
MSAIIDRKNKKTYNCGMENACIDVKKYANAVLYFLTYCNNEYLGKTKLNKLLYYLDFIAFRDRKQSVTMDEYLHEQYGPVPSNIDRTLSELKAEKKIDVEEVAINNDNHKFKYTPLVEPDMNVFDDYEQRLLSDICNEFAMWDTKKIVDQTHLEAAWLYSKPYDKVDFDYAQDIDFFRELQANGSPA